MSSGLSLAKGANLSLTKADPGLKKLHVGLGWSPRNTDGAEFDLDASVFMLDESGKVRQSSDFIYYNQLESPEGSVIHTGDNRTGDGYGYDEVININLSLIPSGVKRIAVTVTIHDAEDRRQNFGQVSDAYIRVVNEETGVEVVRFDLAEDASTEVAMVFAEFYLHNNEWKFRAVGQGYSGGLKALCDNFGLKI